MNFSTRCQVPFGKFCLNYKFTQHSRVVGGKSRTLSVTLLHDNSFVGRKSLNEWCALKHKCGLKQFKATFHGFKPSYLTFSLH